MKILLTVGLLFVIAALSCALRYEIVQKSKIGEAAAKSWQQFVIRTSVQDYNDLHRGDIEKVKEHLMEHANVYAKYYRKKFGPETNTEFAPSLSAGLALYDEWKKTHPQTST